MTVRVTRLEFVDSAGYQIVINGGGKGRTLYFSDGKHGSKRKAQAAANKVRDALNVLLEHYPELKLCK